MGPFYYYYYFLARYLLSLSLSLARSLFPPPQMADSALEIVGITVVVLAALVALVGRSRNSSAAGRWHDECKELLVENFAEVGIPSQNLTLIPESAYEFVLYGTGKFGMVLHPSCTPVSLLFH